MGSQTPVPISVTLRAAERALEIAWSDGVSSRFALAYLRGWCPCAHCQGHFVLEQRFIEGVSAELVDVAPVGTYAMRPTWADGHSSGIYAFTYLRRIAGAPPGDGPSNAALLGS